MKKRPVLVILLLLFLSRWSFSQEYSYTHYDITEGLAGSTVYCITQDKDGYIWTGTETGLSRFDGTHFKNFTPADGLPDIEILQLFADSKGRVWMAPFRKSICFFYRGRIHNQLNDSLLSRIHLQANIEGFAEDDKGNILIQERNELYLVTSRDSVRQLDSLDHRPIHNCLAISKSLSGSFLAQVDDRIVAFSDAGTLWSRPIFFTYQHPNFITLAARYGVWAERHSRLVIESFASGSKIDLPFNNNNFTHVTFSLVDDSLCFDNTADGAYEYNINSGKIRHYLPGQEVSRTFRDGAGNLWFTTIGQGLFRLNSDEFRTLRLSTQKVAQTAIHAIARIGGDLWVGNNLNDIFRLSLPDLQVRSSRPADAYAKVRLLFIDTIKENGIVAAGDNGVFSMSSDFHIGHYIEVGVKSAVRIDTCRLLLATSANVGIFNLRTFHMEDTLWRERATAVCYFKDTIYIGTLNGLYRKIGSRPFEYLGDKLPFLQKRISCIARATDGALFIASYDDAGVIGFKDGKELTLITKKQGLTSNICRSLVVHGDELWIGTDKGLNKVLLNTPDYPVTRYTTNDGLGSDMVNTVFADGNMIYVGTSSGLSFFDESRVRINEECRLHLQALINSGRDRLDDTSHLVLPYTDRNLRLEFAAISYRSVGTITYRYRMIGLDTNWRKTKETSLEYPSLPFGDYDFQLQAVNKFDIPSRLLSVHFTVVTPFWETGWFRAGVGLIILLLAWLLVGWRIRRIRAEQKKKEQLSRKVSELESRALQAQMNPHFIFNCLNSIQQFIFSQDVMAANKYISGFARLIRATLNNSSRSFISIADEADYLSTYLSLEKLRFKDKIDYSIEVDDAIERNNVFLPPMLIQPYVENSMRHGLRHKTTGTGFIRIVIRQQEHRLIVTVEDNGIGRQKARQYKTGEHIEYQSRGMSLTEDRIRMIGAIYGSEITVSIEDLVDEGLEPMGTRVVINLPSF